MTTATLVRRPDSHRTPSAWVWSLLAAFATKIGEIYSRKGSTEPKSESWRYFSA